MARMAYYFDGSKCIGCHGCQVACKQWNQEKAVPTKFVDGYTNPPTLNTDTRMIMKYHENFEKDTVPQLFMLKHQCYHCGEPACVKVCPSGCLTKTAEGIVAADTAKCIACGYCRSACPFTIPTIGDHVNKCDMCLSRTQSGSAKEQTNIPACVKSCSAAALEFGERDKLVAQAKKRVEWLKGRGYQHANLYGEGFLGGLGIISVLTHKPVNYGLPENPSVPVEVTVWKDIFNPMGLLMLAGAFGMTVVHRLMQRGGDDSHSSKSDSTGSGKEDMKG